MKTTLKVLVLGLGWAVAASVAQAAPVEENWENHCTKCHGADGKGETKVGKKLKLKDYSDAAVQAKMTDAEMVKVIVEGVVENEKEKMKPYKDELTKEEITALVAYIRKFKA
jgi:cytochrome c6